MNTIVKWASIIIIICLLLTGCNFHIGDTVIYNNNVYVEIKGWYLAKDEKILEPAWIGYKDDLGKKIKNNVEVEFLKSDDKKLALRYYGDFWDEKYFLRKNIKLPKLYSDNLERIVFYSENKKITMTGEDVIIFKNFLWDCFKNSKSLEIDNKAGGSEVANIELYFKDFPLYYYLGTISRTSSGRLGLESYDLNKSYRPIIIPLVIEEYILNNLN